MQGDLISRSRVIEDIWDVFNSYANDSQRFDEYETEAINKAFSVLQKQIENQPTAYDVEKVDNQILEYFKEQINKKPDGWDIVDFSCDVRNIVRGGGRE